MIASYGSMFAFGILLLAAWAGWGAAIERMVLGRVIADRALQAGWGLAFTILVGGVLNLAAAISPTAIHLFLAAGLGLLVWDAWRRQRPSRTSLRRGLQWLRRSPALALATIIVCGMLFAAYAANVCSTDYNIHDDLQAYFVFPAKMIQTGAMGPDPFSEARILSLGGMSFLHAIVLSVADFRYLRIMEPAVPLLLAVALLLGVARDVRAGPWVAALVALLFLAVPPPTVNVASLVTGLSLFLTLFRTQLRVALRGRPSARSGVLVALIASALCSLKTTHIPACALVVVIACLAQGRDVRSRSSRVRELLVIVGLTLLFMAPWMLASYESNGTPLFPFLGRGFHGSAYAEDWGPYQGISLASAARRVWAASTDLRVIPLWILAGGFLVRRRGRAAGRGLLVAFVLAAVAAFLALAGSHHAVHRYSWAFVWPVTLTLLIYSCRGTMAMRSGGRLALSAAPAALAVGVFVHAQAADARHYWESQRGSIEVALLESRSPGFQREAASRGVRMQKAVPEGAVLLARLQYPFVLDFTRQTILVANYPGGSSPPPGMPFSLGGEPLARYLCAHFVRYVAYSYQSQANFSRRAFKRRLAPGALPWNRAQAKHALDFQANLTELGRTRRRIFDDGDVFVLDLGVSPTGEELGCVTS
jgi:hypothetical protein